MSKFPIPGLSFCHLQESNRLQRRNFETFAAADVLAANDIVPSHHVRLSLGKTCSIPFVGVAWKRIFLPAHDPSHLVFGGLPAMWASECMSALLCSLIEEIALFHGVVSFERWLRLIRKKYSILNKEE
jgi:hypothetical protein